MRFAIRCAAEPMVIVPRVNIPLAGLPNQLARRVPVKAVVFAKQVATLRGEQHRCLARPVTIIHVATALQVDSRLEGLRNRNAPVYTVEVEESLASARLEGTLLQEPSPLLA